MSPNRPICCLRTVLTCRPIVCRPKNKSPKRLSPNWFFAQPSKRPTSYQSLIVTLALSATVFEILTHKARKSLKFSHPPFFEAPVRGGDPLEFCDEIWRQKTRIMELPDGDEIMTLPFFVLSRYRRATDGETDRQTEKETRCDPYYPR